MISQGKPRPPRGRLAGSRHPLPGGCPRGRARQQPPCTISSRSSRSPRRPHGPGHAAGGVARTAALDHPGLAVDLGVGLGPGRFPATPMATVTSTWSSPAPRSRQRHLPVRERQRRHVAGQVPDVQAGPPDRRHRPLCHAQLRRQQVRLSHPAMSIPSFSPRASPRR